jgi:hypothetical protein
MQFFCVQPFALWDLVGRLDICTFAKTFSLGGESHAKQTQSAIPESFALGLGIKPL